MLRRIPGRHRFHIYNVLCGVLIALALLGSARPVHAQDSVPSPYDLIAAVNYLRASNGLPPMEIDGALMASAQAHTEWEASAGTVSHIGPDGSTTETRAIAAGYPVVPGVDMMECIAAGPVGEPLDAIFTGVWSDEIHMNVLLNRQARQAGAGVVEKDGMVYYTLDVAGFWGDSKTTTPRPFNTGEVARLPTTPPIYAVQTVTPQADGSIIHVVQQGQALWNIAMAYGTTVEELCRLNGISNCTNPILSVGQKITVRPGSGGGINALTPVEQTPQGTVSQSTPSLLPTRTIRPSATVEQTRETDLPTATDAAPAGSIFESAYSRSLGILIIIIIGAGLFLFVTLGFRSKEP